MTTDNPPTESPAPPPRPVAIADGRMQRRLRMRRRRKRAYIRSVYFLPSMATLGNAICGFGAIYVCHLNINDAGLDPWTRDFAEHRFLVACYLLLLAMIFDALDGRLARWARHTTDFGGQLDSMADVISFGAAPAMIALALFKYEVPGAPLFVGRLVWAIGAIYVSCAAIRLARFNVSNEHGEQAHMSFLGLPSPGAAAAVIGAVLIQQELSESFTAAAGSSFAGFFSAMSRTMVYLLPAITLAAGLLMVSDFSLPAPREQVPPRPPHHRPTHRHAAAALAARHRPSLHPRRSEHRLRDRRAAVVPVAEAQTHRNAHALTRHGPIHWAVPETGVLSVCPDNRPVPMSTVVTRFAPSPTGYLHVGGARTALFNWLLARHTGGRFLLRIEDTDLARSTEDATLRLVEDLKWLGLNWDNAELVYQSKRVAIYNKLIDGLVEKGQAYEAWETPDELEKMREQAQRPSGRSSTAGGSTRQTK
ncbi:MAG: glutamate--tRNA ligase family protein [Tepidisphaeraceae bacterium]